MESSDTNTINLTNDNNGSEIESNIIYYGVHIPSDVQEQEHDSSSTIYKDKNEALKLVKKYKKARFKAFNYYHEAVEFAVHGSEYPIIVKPNIENVTNKEYNVGEKPPAFRGPKSQDLVKLRKNIELGLIDVVSTTIWENPRYLISSGDTPSILQEGSRYNALHIAAKSKSHSMCELILNTVSDISFIKLLYGDDSNQDPKERANMLLDLYLNTPDKGLNETPLHFAVKFGAVEVVELLVSYPQCDKYVSNKYAKTPSMIICDRCDTVSPIVKNKIAMLLGENFYVPVLRSEDNCIPPVIGEPFAPSSPLSFNQNILDSRMEIHAYAGPMDKVNAEKFRKMWRTPPRCFKTSNHLKKEASVSLKFNDLDKGLERLGKDLATKFDVGWKEYWPFLGGFVDLSSTEGLQILECFLAERFNGDNSTSSSPKCLSSSESESYSNDVSFNNMISPISDLCKNFAACSLNDGSFKKSNFVINLKTSCSAFEPTSHELLTDSQLFKPDLNPFLCIEKSCQVFAHRISNEILHLLESEYSSTSIVLEVQVKQLEFLMTSFMDDSRFISVDFHLVHHRLGTIVGNKLRDVLILEDEFNFMKESLEHWLEVFNKQIDNFSSDDESGTYRQTKRLNKSTSRNQQVQCVLECILNTLTNSTESVVPNITDEDECIKVWSDAKPCACIWNINQTRKNSLIKKSNSFKYTSRGLATPFLMEVACDDKASEENSCDIRNNSTPDSEDEEENFYTPPGSPSLLHDSSEEDAFEDSILPRSDVFIEGNVPTKTDYTVYNAVRCAQNKLNPQDYPNVYRWCHSISLYPEHEQKCWASPKIGKCIINSPIGASTPTRSTTIYSPLNTSNNLSTSWLRITGTNSPRSSFRPNPRGSLSFNL
ncbi:hypothetical protein RN001_003938 [Aquatica leii]|uniref:ANKLE2 third alpha/beta domain-containing protein n=1 Tax=Aquatica leii TaxID=1421715 RepID=A0AAN7PJ18_9COLE|nr:hypothetical protein RN001_003938 [Aquatica leii]